MNTQSASNTRCAQTYRNTDPGSCLRFITQLYLDLPGNPSLEDEAAFGRNVAGLMSHFLTIDPIPTEPESEKGPCPTLADAIAENGVPISEDKEEIEVKKNKISPAVTDRNKLDIPIHNRKRYPEDPQDLISQIKNGLRELLEKKSIKSWSDLMEKKPPSKLRRMIRDPSCPRWKAIRERSRFLTQSSFTDETIRAFIALRERELGNEVTDLFEGIGSHFMALIRIDCSESALKTYFESITKDELMLITLGSTKFQGAVAEFAKPYMDLQSISV